MPSANHNPLVPARQTPYLEFPSGSTISVKIIDTTTTLKVPLSIFMGPKIPGHEDLQCPSYSFLIEHSSGRKLIFDLGVPKDTESYAPATIDLIRLPGWEVAAEKDVAEILEENGVDKASIEGVIWSHWHFDHLGNMGTFPPNVKLIVGPGFKKAALPAYPTNPESYLRESDWEGRELVEVAFSKGLTIGQFNAFDYFGDGSFYILDAPGHAVAHIAGLARVSKGQNGEQDTFVFMGADVCHHGGEWKPNKFFPLPNEVSFTKATRGRFLCPGSAFKSLHRHDTAVEPFYELTKELPYDYNTAAFSVDRLQAFDAAENVLVIISHDSAPLEEGSGFNFFPHGTLNEWKKNRLDERIRWNFLKDFSKAIEDGEKQNTELQAGIALKI